MLRAPPILLLAALAVSARACPPPHPHAAVAGTAAAAGSASAAPAAVWQAKGFSRAAEGCDQIWRCECGAFKAKAGCHMDGTSDVATRGVCAADSGPLTGCDRCMALPPPGVCVCKEACP